MVGRLKVHEFMIISSGGVPVFHYALSESKRLDELLSGFLTAITSFASEFGERSVQSLSFEDSEILYEQTEDAIFIFLVENQAPERILRIVLQELSIKFIKQYEHELSLNVAYDDMFTDFTSIVKEVFDYYEGVLILISKLSSYVVPEKDENALQQVTEQAPFLDEFHRAFGNEGIRVLETINGKKTIEQLSVDLSMEETKVREIIEYLTIWGVLRISQLCPKFGADNERFDAFLDLIGLPSKDYQLLKKARPLCTGTRSITEISERLNVPADRIYEVLMKVGDEVKWNMVEVIGMPPSRLLAI